MGYSCAKKVNEIIDIYIDEYRNYNGKTMECFIFNNNTREKIEFCELITNNNYFEDVTFNEYYIIAFKEIINGNIDILNAYDIELNEIIDLSNEKLKIALNNMFFNKKEVETPILLQAINKENLGIVTEQEISDFKSFITLDNPNITDEEIREYILKYNNDLEKYKTIDKTLTVLEYRQIMNNLSSSYYYRPIPTRLDYLYKKNKVKKKVV